jgi:hypothetical protein
LQELPSNALPIRRELPPSSSASTIEEETQITAPSSSASTTEDEEEPLQARPMARPIFGASLAALTGTAASRILGALLAALADIVGAFAVPAKNRARAIHLLAVISLLCCRCIKKTSQLCKDGVAGCVLRVKHA